MHPERFGRYTLSSEIVNGRGFYVSDFDQGAYGIWWAGSDSSWRIGPISKTGERYGLRAYIDEQCVDNVHSWESFGSTLKIKCVDDDDDVGSGDYYDDEYYGYTNDYTNYINPKHDGRINRP